MAGRTFRSVSFGHNAFNSTLPDSLSSWSHVMVYDDVNASDGFATCPCPVAPYDCH